MTAGRLIGSLAAGVVLGVGLWLLGVVVWFAVSLAVLLAAICLVWGVVTRDQQPSVTKWPVAAVDPRPGARSDVAWLAWTFRQNRGSVREQGFSAVRALAVRRLERRGLDLSDPAHRERIVHLIGEHAYATLTPKGGIMPSLRAIERCLDALETVEGPRRS